MKIIFLGTNNFAAAILKSLIKKIKIHYVITKNDSKHGRGQIIKPSPVKNISLIHNIETYTIKKSINDEKNFIQDKNPDIIILIEYGEKISEEIICIPKYGIINVHPSILPNLKGSMPIEHAIINGLTETGVSIIKINNKIDSGPILNVKTCKIFKHDTYDSLSLKLQKLSLKALIETLNIIKQNKISETKQIDENNLLWAYKLDKKFYKIDWTKSAIQINRNIRSTFSKTTHYSKINNDLIKVIDTKIIYKIKKSYQKLSAGTIMKISRIGIDVKTGENIIRIKKLQFPGKKIQKVSELLNSINNKIKDGYKFL